MICNYTDNTFNNAIVNGIFLIISYNYIDRIITIKIIDKDSNILIKIVITNVTFYFNRLPFHIYNRSSVYRCYDGFIYNPQDTEPSDFINLFTTTNNFL